METEESGGGSGAGGGTYSKLRNNPPPPGTIKSIGETLFEARTPLQPAAISSRPAQANSRKDELRFAVTEA
jgi:hypothetical protein